MNVLLVYFTGTYNTRFVSSLLKDKFIKTNNSVTLYEYSYRNNSIDLSKYDLIGIGYPIYAFNSPKVFNKFLKKIDLKDKDCFIYKDSGETLRYNDSSSRTIKHILKQKNAHLLYEMHIAMPYNIIFPFENIFIKELVNYADKSCSILVYDLLNHNKVIIKDNIYYRTISYILSIINFGAYVNHLFYKVDYKKCIHCNMCLYTCPNHNIVIKNNKYKFKKNCSMCMRCSFYCPKSAIDIGFLEPWKLKNYYNLTKISISNKAKTRYINEDSKGFYKCFVKTFNKVDNRYKEIYEEIHKMGL
ncbi:MAG: EFR1 family ferrodoxin [Bacilli bacterium]